MRVLLAFDKFKHALTAEQACETAARALRAGHPDWTLDLCPLADGGEGFAEILTRAAGGRLVRAPVAGPRGERIEAAFGLVPLRALSPAAQSRFIFDGPHGPADEIAVLEMASASGLALLPPPARDPWEATTLGTGELIRAAAAAGAKTLLLGVGGSATHDLGLGALSALGLDFLTAGGAPVRPPVPAQWKNVARIAGAAFPGLPPIVIACDVENPLLGPRGAVAVYGPQKGLRPGDAARLERESERMAALLEVHCRTPAALRDAPGAGAAGGLSFGLLAGARARLVPGFDLVAAWLDLEGRLAAADLVLTGEGRFDDSSLSGKGPGTVARRALALGKSARVFAGQVTLADIPPGLELHALTESGTPLERALRETAVRLDRAVRTFL